MKMRCFRLSDKFHQFNSGRNSFLADKPPIISNPEKGIRNNATSTFCQFQCCYYI
jgi:hypothetical protein